MGAGAVTSQRLSWGPATFFYKFVAPWILTSVALFFSYSLAFAPALDLPGWSVLPSVPLRILLCLGSAATAWWYFSLSARLVLVEVDNHNIFLSNYRRQIAVPLELVQDVSEANWLHIHPITIEFDDATAFGRRVTFLPDMTNQWFRFASHPAVSQLQEAADRARRVGGGTPA